MVVTAKRLVSVLAIAVIAGCAHGSGERVPDAERTSIVKGTVTYRERMTLPPDAVVEVWIADVSPLILGLPPLAEATVRPEGRQVPLPFELRYNPDRVDPKHDYVVKAAIRTGGEILFQTEAMIPVITKGHPLEVALWLIRAKLDAMDAEDGAPEILEGTTWRLTDLGGADVLGRVEATLEFPEAGRISGNGSCNRFFGTVVISGESIQIGILGSTRMACPEEVGLQEENYFRALEGAERLRFSGSTLLIECAGLEQPLRFRPMEN